MQVGYICRLDKGCPGHIFFWTHLICALRYLLGTVSFQNCWRISDGKLLFIFLQTKISLATYNAVESHCPSCKLCANGAGCAFSLAHNYCMHVQANKIVHALKVEVMMVLLLCCCLTFVVNSYGYVGTVS